MRVARTDFLVLMDDDVFVEPGWADALLAGVNSRVGVVTPVHYDAYGRFNYAGIIMHGDRSGGHRHDLELPSAPIRNMTLCSAVMLIDLAKCGHLRMDENYSKYFLDIDYGLSVWEAGYEVLCTPHAQVTHIGGATLEQGSSSAYMLHEPQRQYFVAKWMATGRYERLEAGPWQSIPEFARLREEGAADAMAEVAESYRWHSIVQHDGRWYAISEGYRSLTPRRIHQRYFRRMVAGASLEEVKQALDRMAYPKLLVHARIALYAVRRVARIAWLQTGGLTHRVLRRMGFRVQRFAGRGARFVVRAFALRRGAR
jgi:hypothetical protein